MVDDFMVYVDLSTTFLFRRLVMNLVKLFLYPTERELKAKNNGSHATFLDLDNSIDQGRFIDKRLDKRDAFNSNIVKMASIISNIPSIILHSFTSSYKIVRQILKLIVIEYQQMFITRN